MKVFQVVHEEDEGPAVKEGHKSVVNIRKVNTFYAARDIEALLLHLYKNRADEKTITSISEIIPSLRVLE